MNTNPGWTSRPLGAEGVTAPAPGGWAGARSLRTAFKVLLGVLLIGFLVYKARFAPIPVGWQGVQRGVVVAETLGTGTLEARITTTISPRIQERLVEMRVDQGDAVGAGQLLVVLDDGELRRQVEVAEATLAGAKATVERVLVDEVRSRAVENQARLEHKRNVDLLATKVSSQADMDKANEMLRVAEADFQRARAATAEARQAVITAERYLAYHRERLGFARILSPYDGLVTRRDRDPGGVVVPGGSLLQLISTNEMWVSAWVDETAAADLAVGQGARVVFRSERGRVVRGQVARLGRETDRETREFLVDVSVADLPQNWTVGQRAEVFIETAHKSDVLTLPPRFLEWREGKPGVFLEKGGVAVWRDITLGVRGGETVEILEGLQAGDIAISKAQGTQTALRAGQRVVLK